MEANYQNAAFPELREFQKTAHESLRDGAKKGHRTQVIMAPTGAGKCLGYGTPVLMADGSIKEVQDVEAGDALIGPDGGYRTVLSVTEGTELLYKVTPVKGNPYVVNASHILSLRKTFGADGMMLSDGSKIAADDDIVNVNVETFLNSNATVRYCLKGWRSDAIELFMRDDEEMPIPPYIVGAWLGDGSQGHAAISKPQCKMVDEWIAYGRSIGYGVRVSTGNSGCPTWHITNGRDGKRYNAIKDMLNDIGILHDRHVPDAYKYAPIAERLQVLAGLIDSDGHISHSGCDWISKSQRLADDFAFMCRSAGLACYLSKQKKSIRETGFSGWYWKATVSGDLSKIPMRDKVVDGRRQKKRHLVHGIDIEPLDEGSYFGFEIDGDGLFLLGDFTVTHNTVLALNVVHEALLRGKRATFVCDRTTLINQTSKVADQLGLGAHGVIQANHWRLDRSLPFQIASVQTLARRHWPESDVIIVDECHTRHKAWVDHVASTKARVIGLSATPFSKGLGKIFTNLINAATMHELTQDGILVPMKVFSCARIDMRGAETRNGEWTDKAAEERGLVIVGDVVSEWKKYGGNRKTIAFGPTIAHCEKLCGEFNDAGVPAAVFTSRTTEDQRKELLDEYRKPNSFWKILISVEALAKGFDVPDVGCIIDLRPLRKSLSTAIQMWGRGLRSSPETGKETCILLDHSQNIVRFAEDFSDIYFNGLSALDSGEKLDSVIRLDKELDDDGKKCPKCGFQPFAKRCIACGHEAQSLSLAQVVPGSMRELTIGHKKHSIGASDIWAQVCTYTKTVGNPETARGRAWNLFKHCAGYELPRSMPQFEMTPNVVLSREIINKIRQKHIAYAKSRGR